MARVPLAAQIDLRFGDAAREVLDLGVGLCPGNFARERFHLFGQGWIGTNGQAQPVTKGISRRASAATCSLRASAGPCVRMIGPDLAVAGQAALFFLAAVVSITLNSASSISCTLRRSASPRTIRRRSISFRLALRRVSAMAVKRSIRSMWSRFLASAWPYAHASVGKKLDRYGGLWFPPRILLHEFFCLAIPRTIHDVLQIQSAVVQIHSNYLDLLDSAHFILNVTPRQRVRIFAILNVILQNSFEVARKVVSVRTVFEPIS